MKNKNLQEKLKAFGPGILTATAAIGGSHIVSSTQAGALYGWKLLVIIILVNIFKYPFMSMGTKYALTTGDNLIVGYSKLKKRYVIIFYVLMLFSTVANLAAVAMLSGALIQFVLPQLSIRMWTIIIIIISLLIVMLGGYKVLDKFSKIVMLSLTIFTIIALIISAINYDPTFAQGFVENSPFNFASLPFMISLMGWMPAPIELSVISSIWNVEKNKELEEKVSLKNGLLDYNVSYLMTIVLALCFLAMGVFTQYGKGTAIEGASAAYIKQFVSMYANSFGEWSTPLIAIIAFLCIFGTTFTVLDGYTRATIESNNAIFGLKPSTKQKNIAYILFSLTAIIVVVFFSDRVALLMKIAMILSFLTAPYFAFINYKVALNTPEIKISKPLKVLSILGFIFLVGFALLFIFAMFTGRAGL